MIEISLVCCCYCCDCSTLIKRWPNDRASRRQRRWSWGTLVSYYVINSWQCQLLCHNTCAVVLFSDVMKRKDFAVVYSLLLMLTPCEISMDRGGNLLLLLAGFRFGSLDDVPNKWSRARLPRLRYCLWNPIFILDKSERRDRVQFISKYRGIWFTALDKVQ